MLDVEKVLLEAWDELKSGYNDGKKCEEEFDKGNKRSAREYSYRPWNELDACYLFAKKVEELYAREGLKAEIHQDWDITKWYVSEADQDFQRMVKENFPSRRRFDMWIASPYAAFEPTFDVIMEFKMYREGKGDYHPWETLEKQVNDLLRAKDLKIASRVVVALINRGGLSAKKWGELLDRLSSYKNQDLIVLPFDAGPW